MTLEPLLAANFERGGWAAVRVILQNDGPAIDGELRLAISTAASSTYGVPVQLATGSRQEHVLYAPVGAIGNVLAVRLVSGSTVHGEGQANLEARSRVHVFVVGERPETLVGPIGAALARRGGGRPAGQEPAVLGIRPSDLPDRVEAWQSIDMLVLHDVDSASLSGGQLDALRTWISLGGDTVTLAGSLGPGAFAAYPDELLPFRPNRTIDVPLADVATLLGDLPAAAAPLPALAGELRAGTALALSGDAVVAARLRLGAGSTTLVGINPSVSWLVGPPADAFWSRFLPPLAGTADPGLPADDEFLVSALGALPAAQLPRSDHLLLLVLAYIVTIGPINYLLLKRRDRREWAWLTMPVTIAAFAVAAYGLGVLARGADIVVNQVVVVHAAAGGDRGLADARIGVFSPGRAEFDIRVGGRALLSAPSSASGGAGQRALDVLLGEPATVRRYGVGFGALRAFRAEATVPTPLVEASLSLDGETLSGTVTNASSVTLSDVAVVLGSDVQMLGELDPGASRPITLRARANFDGEPLSWRLYPFTGEQGPDRLRLATRRAVVQHLGGGWEEGFGNATSAILGSGPVVLAWVPGGLLPVDTGTAAEHVGETLYLYTARAEVTGPVSFTGNAIAQTALSVDAADGFAEAPHFFLSRGTITADYQPLGIEGQFTPSALLVRLDVETPRAPGRSGSDLAPLPDDEQPASDDPLGSNPRPAEGAPDAPRLQLFDRVTASWVELEPIRFEETLRIAAPERYVDESGTFRVRFVERQGSFVTFTFTPRLEGTVR